MEGTADGHLCRRRAISMFPNENCAIHCNCYATVFVGMHSLRHWQRVTCKTQTHLAFLISSFLNWSMMFCRMLVVFSLTTVETVFLALTLKQQIKEKKLKWTHCKTPNTDCFLPEYPLLAALHGKDGCCRVLCCSFKLPLSLGIKPRLQIWAHGEKLWFNYHSFILTYHWTEPKYSRYFPTTYKRCVTLSHLCAQSIVLLLSIGNVRTKILINFVHGCRP